LEEMRTNFGKMQRPHGERALNSFALVYHVGKTKKGGRKGKGG